jgi:diguanylate cyclase (GGDEF)-like protein
MSDLIGSVANLTGYRDRDLIDSTFVSVLGDWLDPLRLSLYRCVGDVSDLRLLLQAGMARGQGSVAADPSWTAIEALPALASRPHFEQAFAATDPLLDLPQNGSDGPWLNLFAVWAGSRRFGIIELVAEQPLLPVQLRLVDGLLKIYRNQITLLDYSERDSLTGLLNRKTFDEQFVKCIEPLPAGRTAENTSTVWWLGVIDIDHFKRVNDTFGHLIGDEVLLLVARLLRSSFRHTEQLYRFGGEEFIVLLRAEHEGEARLAFEFFRKQLSSFRLPSGRDCDGKRRLHASCAAWTTQAALSTVRIARCITRNTVAGIRFTRTKRCCVRTCCMRWTTVARSNSSDAASRTASVAAMSMRTMETEQK